MHAGEAQALCYQCLDRKVRVQTTSGQIYEGVVCYVDNAHVYLRIPHHVWYGTGGATSGGGCGCGGGASTERDGRQPFFFGNPGFYYNDVILPLTLFTLLAIALA